MKPPKYYRKFDYDKSLIPNKYIASIEQSISTIEEAKAKTGLSIGYPGWCLIYYTLLSHLNPSAHNLIVETGTNQGWTTIMLAQALRDSNSRGRIYTVELDKENYQIALTQFQQAGVADLIKAINGDSRTVLNEIVSKHDSIRAAFLDASHLFHDVIAEFEVILPALGPQSIVIFDNTYAIAEKHEDQRVNGALKEIVKRYGGNLVNLEFVSWYTPGIAIWQKSPFDSLQTIEANNNSKHNRNAKIFLSDRKKSQDDIMRHSQEELKLWEISKKLFSMVEYSDFKRALECIALIEKRIIGRHCGDLGDKLSQYLTIIQFFRESGVDSADSLEIGTLFGGSCLLKLMAMKDLNVKGKIVCIDPMGGYYGKNVDPYSGIEVSADILFKNLDIFGIHREAIELRRMPSNDSKATAGFIKSSFATLMIDGDHSYQGVLYDWDKYSAFVNEAGFAIFDDYADSDWPDITKFVTELSSNLPHCWNLIGQIGTTFLIKKNANSIELELSLDSKHRKNSNGHRQEKAAKISSLIGGRDKIDDAILTHASMPTSAPPQYESKPTYESTTPQVDVLTASDTLLAQYKDKHLGQRCIIIGNGPSLNKMDLSFLKNEITFGLNRIYLMFDEWNFNPTYYVSVNPLVIEQSIEEIKNISAIKFLSLNGLPYVKNPQDIIFLKSLYNPHFSKDPRKGIWEGYTVTYVAMQLAYFMGFNEVILIGVDHSFIAPGTPNDEVISEGADQNHFHPDYFGKGTRWNLPDLKNSELAYTYAKTSFENEGRRIVDATIDGKLQVFPKNDYKYLITKYQKIDGIEKNNKSEIAHLIEQGEVFFSKGQLQSAQQEFEKVLEICPKNATALNNIGVLYYHQGDHTEASEFYKKAIEIQPENITFQKNLAEIKYVILGQVQEALQIYINIFQAHPDDIDVLLGLGKICIDLEKFVDARGFLNRIIELEPSNVEAQHELHQLKCGKKDRSSEEGDSVSFVTDKDSSEKYLVTAIVSTYNSQRYISGRLKDLENQTISDHLEIIVVDSGSEQNEATIVKDFQEKYSNIKYIRTECRETVYAAWNRGIQAAQGQYITNANADDRLRHDALEVMVNALEANPEIALVYANVLITETENETFERCTPVGFFNWLDFNREDLMNKGCFVGPQPMWRKKVHDEYGYFDDSFITSGDYEFWLRISQSHAFMHLPVQLGLYLRSQDSIEHSNRDKQGEENQKILNIYRKARSSGKIIRRIQARTSPGHSESGSEKAKSPEIIYRSIQAGTGNKKPEEKIKELEKMAAAFPDFAMTFNDLGILYYNTGDKEKSLKCYENAVRHETGNMIFQKNLADFYYVEMGRVEDALKIYIKILKSNPEDVQILLITGHICVAMEKFQDARVFYSRILEIEPGHQDARQFLDKLNSMEAGPSGTKTPELLYREVQPLLNNGNPNRAIEALEGLLEQFPDYALAYNDLGVLYYHIGDKEKAQHHYERAVEMMPKNINLQKNLADFYCLELGRIEEALNIYVGILTTHPRDIETLLATGRICEALKRPGDAKAFYYRVLELAPGNEDASSNLQALDSHPAATGLSLSEFSDTPSILTNKVEFNNFEPNRLPAENRTDTVSIIVSLDGIQSCVKECIKSVMAHTSESHEILLINSGASKGILKWAQQLIKDNHHYHIIECARQAGRVESLNKAIQIASGEMIVVMHNDAVVPEGWLNAFKKLINLETNIGVLGPMSNRAEGIQQMINGDESDRVEFETTAQAFFEQNQYRRVATGNLSDFCLVFPRELPDKIGYFDEQFGSEEVAIEDYCKRAAAGGYQNLIAADTYVHHYDRHKAPKSASARKQIKAKDRKKYKQKWNGTQNPNTKALVTVQLLARADELSQKGQIDPAVELLLATIGVQPENPGVYLGLSEILLAAKRFQDAKEALIEMPPGDENQKMRKTQLLAYAEEGLENYEAAQAQIEQVLLMNPGHPPALNLKGILAYRNGDCLSAEKYFERAIDSDPGYGEPYTNLGMLSLETDRLQDALNFFEKAFCLTPTDLDIATNYHSYIGATADFTQAEVLAREAAVLYPNNQKIKYMLIDFLIQQGKYEMAMPEIEDAIIKFGSDNGIIGAALKVREKLGPITIQKFSKKASVSVCMIIKDEEKYLARCLASVKPIVDEMIVVDTGSTDRSRDIAIAFGAKVYDYEWKNDFAAARNYSISKASGEWILILDGDEVISALDHEHFSKMVKKTPRAPLAYSIITRNYNKLANIVGWMPNDGTYPNEEAAIGWLPSEKVRLFFGKDQIWFEGAVHELVDPVLKRNGIEIQKCRIPVHHYGRLDKEKLDRKGEIYFDIGRKKLSTMGDDLNALRELAIQATILEKNQEAFELWQRLLALNPNPTLAAVAYVNMGTIYNRQGKFEDALDAGKKAVECDPDLKEARYNQAMAELHCGNALKTIRVLEDLLKGFFDYPPAQFILSAAYCCAGQKEKGLEGIIKLRDTPMGAHLDIPSLELAQSLISAGKMEYALCVLGAAIESDIVNPKLLTLFKECLDMKETTQKCSHIPQPSQANFHEAILQNLPQ